MVQFCTLALHFWTKVVGLCCSKLKGNTKGGLPFLCAVVHTTKVVVYIAEKHPSCCHTEESFHKVIMVKTECGSIFALGAFMNEMTHFSSPHKVKKNPFYLFFIFSSMVLAYLVSDSMRFRF